MVTGTSLTARVDHQLHAYGKYIKHRKLFRKYSSLRPPPLSQSYILCASGSSFQTDFCFAPVSPRLSCTEDEEVQRDSGEIGDEVRSRESTGTQASVNFYILNFFRLPEHCSELKTTTTSSIQISRSSIRSSKTARSPASRSSSSDRPSSPGLSSASGGWSASLRGCVSAGPSTCIGHP